MTRHWLELANQWLEVTRQFLLLDSDSTRPNHGSESTRKNFRWLWLEGLVTMTRLWLDKNDSDTSLDRAALKICLFSLVRLSFVYNFDPPDIVLSTFFSFIRLLLFLNFWLLNFAIMIGLGYFFVGGAKRCEMLISPLVMFIPHFLTKFTTISSVHLLGWCVISWNSRQHLLLYCSRLFSFTSVPHFVFSRLMQFFLKWYSDTANLCWHF